MKKEYVRPTMIAEQFFANEYVAACGESGKVYKFECNAGDKGLMTFPYKVYVDSNDNGVYDEWFLWKEGDEYLGTYHACGVTHEAKTTDTFLSGFMIDTRWDKDSTPQKVIIWRGPDGTNVHCTTNLDMSTWTTAKS